MAKKLGIAPTVHETAQVVDSTLGRFVEVGARTSVVESSLGDYSYIVNDGQMIYTTVGKFCSIAAHVRINPGNHPMWRVTQSHFTYRAAAYFDDAEDETEFFEWRRSHPVTIGHDVWIGHGAIIMPGRSVGTGAIVGAGAVVTHDVPDYAIVIGQPARVLRQRFPDDVAGRLKALRWWDWEHDRLRAALPDFRSLPVAAFLERYEGASA